MNSNKILEVEHVNKSFYLSKKEKLKAVNDVSFSLYENETLGIVGESGCGKTTLARLIVSLYEVDEGKIIFNNEIINKNYYSNELKKLKKSKLDKKQFLIEKEKLKSLSYGDSNSVQMIFQDPIASINPRMSIYDVIKEGLVIQGEKDENIIAKKVYNVLEKVGLSKDIINRFPNEFSGGQLQRIGIARALIMNPKIIIADEIVSALDVSIQSQIINLLNEIKKEGLSIIFIAHNLNIVKYFCNRIIVMYKGQIVEMAPSEELFNNPLHPYTKKLVESIPLPDPNIEKSKKESSEIFDYIIGENSSLIEVKKDHFVRGIKDEKN